MSQHHARRRLGPGDTDNSPVTGGYLSHLLHLAWDQHLGPKAEASVRLPHLASHERCVELSHALFVALETQRIDGNNLAQVCTHAGVGD